MDGNQFFENFRNTARQSDGQSLLVDMASPTIRASFRDYDKRAGQELPRLGTEWYRTQAEKLDSLRYDLNPANSPQGAKNQETLREQVVQLEREAAIVQGAPLARQNEFRDLLRVERELTESGITRPEDLTRRLSVLRQISSIDGSPTRYSATNSDLLFDRLSNEPVSPREALPPDVLSLLESYARQAADGQIQRLQGTQYGALYNGNFLHARNFELTGRPVIPGIGASRNSEVLNQYRDLIASPSAVLNQEYRNLAVRDLVSRYFGTPALSVSQTDRMQALREFPENLQGQRLVERRLTLARANRALSTDEQAQLDALQRFPYNPRAAELARRENLASDAGRSLSTPEQEELSAYTTLEGDRRARELAWMNTFRDTLNNRDREEELSARNQQYEDARLRAHDPRVRPARETEELWESDVERSRIRSESGFVRNLQIDSARTFAAINSANGLFNNDEQAIRRALNNMTDREHLAMRWGERLRYDDYAFTEATPETRRALVDYYLGLQRLLFPMMTFVNRPIAESLLLEDMAYFAGGSNVTRRIANVQDYKSMNRADLIRLLNEVRNDRTRRNYLPNYTTFSRYSQ